MAPVMMAKNRNRTASVPSECSRCEVWLLCVTSFDAFDAFVALTATSLTNLHILMFTNKIV